MWFKKLIMSDSSYVDGIDVLSKSTLANSEVAYIDI